MVFSNQLMRSIEPPSKKRALRIARRQIARKQAYFPQTKDITIYENLSDNCHIFEVAPGVALSNRIRVERNFLSPDYDNISVVIAVTYVRMHE